MPNTKTRRFSIDVDPRDVPDVEALAASCSPPLSRSAYYFHLTKHAIENGIRFTSMMVATTKDDERSLKKADEDSREYHKNNRKKDS
jgi:hypothetical protein